MGLAARSHDISCEADLFSSAWSEQLPTSLDLILASLISPGFRSIFYNSGSSGSSNNTRFDAGLAR